MVEFNFANFNDLLPILKEQLGEKCPPDDVLREIVVKTIRWTFDRFNNYQVEKALEQDFEIRKLPTIQTAADLAINDELPPFP